MRAYQLEGLNWLIKLHENGVHGSLESYPHPYPYPYPYPYP